MINNMCQKKPGIHLKFYFDNIEDMTMLEAGLCTSSDMGHISKEILEDFFNPDEGERYQLFLDGCSRLYWGAGTPDGEFHSYIFTPLRQTIVLFMAAINNEL